MAKDKALGENGAYWAQRMRFYEQACAQKNAKITAEIEAAFSKANSDIEKDLEYWYGRLAKNNGISLAAARRLLDADELAEFKWSVDEYMAKAMQSGNGKWFKELENASARVHISRLEAMKISMRNTLESAFATENSIVTNMAANTYRDAVRHTAAEMEKLFKAEFNIAEIDDEKIQKLIRKPWTSDARTFSDRIWSKKNEMINALQEELTRGCIYGRSLDDTIARMEKFVDAKFKNVKYAARRIVVTESAYFRVLGTRDELMELGVTEFQVDLPIDSKTCEICREMNGRIFPMSEFAVGLNAPPFHPNCENGSIIPMADEDFEAALKEAREKDEKKSVNIQNGNTEFMSSVSNNWDGANPIPHTNEELDDLKKYAEEHGIKLYTRQPFDGDISVIKSEIDVIEKIRADFNHTDYLQLGWKSMSVNDFGETSANHQQIWINKLALRERAITERNLAADNFLATNTAEGIAAHEMGHVISGKIRNGKTGLDIYKETVYNVSGKQISDTEAIELLYSNVSEYSIDETIKMNGSVVYEEIISEMLSVHYTKPNKYSTEFVKLLREALK